MKQWLQKIIVSAVMLGIFLAPFSAGIKIKNGNFKANLETNKALASLPSLPIIFKPTYLKIESKNGNSAIFSGEIKINENKEECPDCAKPHVTDGMPGYQNIIYDVDPGESIHFIIEEEKDSKHVQKVAFSGVKGLRAFSKQHTSNPFKINTLEFRDPSDSSKPLYLKPNTDYTIHIAVFGKELKDYGRESTTVYVPTLSIIGSKVKFKTDFSNPNDAPETAYDPNNRSTAAAYGEGSGYDLGCSLNPLSPNLVGCLAGILYSFWEASSFVAHLTAKTMDFFVYYSTNSSSYDNIFVEKSWSAIRDIANIFFIIALLYVAIRTILGLHVSDNKKLISYIILIALIINFSLFTTKLVIDGSNILAKVFYNNITPIDENGNPLPPDSGGQKSISVGIIEKFNPQTIVSVGEYANSPGSFIFVTILALGITLYTAYVFFSVAIFFVSRVVALWLYMIFSPIAFASYTVPFEMPGFGHKEWWDQLIKNALLAPLFIFFLYIIILFTGFLKEIVLYSDKTNITEYVMTTIIPFAIIFILLNKSKELATKYAGEIGGAVSKASTAITGLVGGLAIGGASLGVAALGRNTIGAFMKGASTGDSTSQRYERGESLGKWDKFKGRMGSALRISSAEKWVGERLNKDQQKIEKAAHARHELDTEASAMVSGAKWNDLNGEQRFRVRRKLARDRAVRENSGNDAVNNPLELALGNRKWDSLTNEERAKIDEHIGADSHLPGGVVPGGLLDTHRTYADEHTVKEAKIKQGVLSSVVQSTVTGSYDARNLSQVSAIESDTKINKLLSHLTNAVGKGMKSGLKNIANINYGEGKKDFLKDLGHTISESLKSAKINVDLSHVGEVKKESAHGHGGGGHDKDEHGGGHDAHAGGGGHH